jgi:hypothetical protein
MKSFILFLTAIAWATSLFAQPLPYAQYLTAKLCSNEFAGRGYVQNGVNKAADFLVKEFKKNKIKHPSTQSYSFSVNTHPYAIKCKIDHQAIAIGESFLIDAGAGNIKGNFQLVHFNFKDSIEKILLMKKIKMGFADQEALVVRYSSARQSHVIDSCKAYAHLPKLIIFTEEKKLTHTINTELDDFNSMIFIDSVIQNKEQLEIEASHQWIENFTCKNIIASVKGKKTDSFIVYSAHYDHLGMQGEAMFPGASDNASGVSMIMNLATYFAKNKPNYTTYFILFSGEEAGLLGSNYFTTHPTFAIEKIKMLVNIDIMGNAEKGITVVNGEVYKPQFNLLSSINADNHFLPEIKSRGKAANSDHYFFSEKGIPSIFIYSMGGQGYYHDIYDKADALQFTNYENLFTLLLEFGKRL